MTKSGIRREIREKLSKQSSSQRLRKSRLIKEELFNLPEFKTAGCVMFYIAKKEEVETDFMITAALKTGKKIAVPAVVGRERRMVASLTEDFEKKELTLGPYGILQPRDEDIDEIPAGNIDFVVVPGLAFDKQGNRLGRGGGYYDRFLAGLPTAIPRVGLAFDFQVLQTLPVLSHDIFVTKVISA